MYLPDKQAAAYPLHVFLPSAVQLRAEFCSTLQLSSVAKPRSSVKTLYQPYFFCTFFMSVSQLRQTELQPNISKLHVAED
jgi:hypothetical protein